MGYARDLHKHALFSKFGTPSILLEALSSIGNAELGKTLDWLLEEWFGHIENIGDLANKKLMVLALTGLLEVESGRFVLEKLQNLITVWTDVLDMA